MAEQGRKAIVQKAAASKAVGPRPVRRFFPGLTQQFAGPITMHSASL